MDNFINVEVIYFDSIEDNKHLKLEKGSVASVLLNLSEVKCIYRFQVNTTIKGEAEKKMGYYIGYVLDPEYCRVPGIISPNDILRHGLIEKFDGREERDEKYKHLIDILVL